MSNQMKIGILADSLRLDITDAIVCAHKLGAEGIQLYAAETMAPERLTVQARRDIRNRAHDNGLVISALVGNTDPYGLTSKTDNIRVVDINKRIMDLAKDLDCNVISAHIGVVPTEQHHPRYAIMHDACEAIGAYGDNIGVVFGVETGPETAGTLAGFLASLKSGSIRVNLDPANLIMCMSDDAADDVYTLKDYIVHTHAKDGRRLKRCNMELMYNTYGITGEPIEESEYCYETPLGEGQVNFYKYLSALKDIGYTGFLTIERETGNDPAADIAAAIVYLRQMIRQIYIH
jgi:sugar phosphate isomerase/epimerase